MAEKVTLLTDEEYRIIGSRFASHLIAQETSDAHARWSRDVSFLGSYGHGRGMFSEFLELRLRHDLLRKERGDVLAAKMRTVRERNEAVSAGWNWVDKASSILRRFAHRDASLAERYNNNIPSDDSKLAAGIGGLSSMLADVQGLCHEDDQVSARLAEAEPLVSSLDTLPGMATAGKIAAIKDTAEIDVLDGKLYIMIRNLNTAARKAIRNGDLDVPLSDYRFHHVSRSGKAGAEPSDPTPVG